MMEELIQRILAINHTVVISERGIRNQIKECIRKTGKLVDITYKTFSQTAAEIIGTYPIAARIQLARDENLSPDTAAILLKNSLLVNDSYQNQKIYHLHKIRAKYAAYLEKNPLSLNRYRGKTVFVVGDDKTNDLFQKSLLELKTCAQVFDYQLSRTAKNPIEILVFPTVKAEIENAAKEIAKLLDMGISCDHIRIHSVSKDYVPYVREVFSLYDMDISLDERHTVSEYEAGKLALKLLSELMDCPLAGSLSTVIQKIPESPVRNEIVNIFNNYLSLGSTVRDVFSDLEYTFRTAILPTPRYKNVIQITDLTDMYPSSDDYLFILGFNQDVFPITHRDEEYLLDHERKKLGLTTSAFRNLQEKKKCLSLLENASHLYLSYPLTDGHSKLVRSGLYHDLKKTHDVKEIRYQPDYRDSYCESMDRISLGKMLDLYYKYDVRPDHLPLIYQNYADVPYKKSSHRVRGLSEAVQKQLKEHPLTLSYTSIDEYYQCAYKFYLEKILKIVRNTNEDALYIGNLFHECLHRMLLEETIADPALFLDDVIAGYLASIQKVPSKKERFFIAKYKEILRRWYEETLKQQKRSDFTVYSLEKEFSVNHGVKLAGKVDKILTAKIGDEQYAIVVDYKSGSAEIDLNKVLYGLGMQIPFYFLFLKECLSDTYHFAGGYLQQVLPNGPFAYDPDLSIDEQYEKHFRLVGYSNPEMKVISRIDRDFDSGKSFISGMKVNKDGYFSARTKIITEEEFQKLLRLSEEKIEEAIRRIVNADFAINPKKLGTFDSCAFCPFGDLCYRDSSDYLELEKHTDLDFLKETV